MEAKVLRQKAHLRARRHISYRRAEQFAFAARGRDQPQQHLDGGRLARAVRAEEAKHLALGHVQREVGYGDFIAEYFAEVVRFDCVLLRARCCSIRVHLSATLFFSSTKNTKEHKNNLRVPSCPFVEKLDIT